MKKSLSIALFGCAFSFSSSFGATVFTDNFTYANGALVGNGGWTQNLTVATNPIQVTDGIVPLTTGQDVYNNFTAAISATDGTFAYYAARIVVTAATASGEYFLHFTNGLTNPSFFTARLAAQSTAGGFFLGYSESTVAGTTYGTQVLTLSAPYNVIVRYGFVAGTLNDTGAVFVSAGAFDPVELSNTPYLTDAYNGATAEIGNFTGFQLRQGAAANAPAVVVDNLIVGNTFADVSSIPEPTTSLLGMLGTIGLLRRRR